jgi:hypothetical protein
MIPTVREIAVAREILYDYRVITYQEFASRLNNRAHVTRYTARNCGNLLAELPIQLATRVVLKSTGKPSASMARR